MRKIKFILRRLNVFLCDLAVSYALFYLLLFIRPIGFPILSYYFCVVALYFALTCWLFRGSFMQKLFGITITKRPLIYILFKIGLTGLIPFVLFFLHHDILGILYLFVTAVLTLLLLPFTKKTIWQLCSGAQIELQNDFNRKKIRIIIPLFASLFLLLFQWIRQSPHFNVAEIITDKNRALPISIPEKTYYVKNIEQYKQEPVDYVMQLFDKYDIVILCERWHPECTQWEFFSKMILNDTFAEKVKNVFTELGEVRSQEILDSYMQTHFSTEKDLQRATARIAREMGGCWPVWNNKNIYDFILNLHQFNESKDSVSRINYFFSDVSTDWDAIQNPAQWDSIITHTNRDSIMAQHILNRYEEQRLNKCLIITNTRHAWKYGKNEAAYIFKKYPDKTAVVWINGTTQFFTPAMNGTLDEAVLEIQDNIWAIDFENCPLGNTHFDLMPSNTPEYNKLTYKNLFTGMIYCQHPSNWERVENYPFMLDNYEDTLLKRSALVGEDYLRMITNAIERGSFDKIEKQDKNPFVILYNWGFLTLHSVVLIFLSLNLLILLFKKQN